MKLFLLGVCSSALIAGLIAALREVVRKRRTFVTKHGQEVYDMGVPDKVGYTLTKAQIEAAEDEYLAVAESYGFTLNPEKIKKFFKANSILFYPYPIRSAAYKPTGFIKGDYGNKTLRLGLQPFVHSTALIHEWTHGVLEETTGIPDTVHSKGDIWERGFVGVVNDRLKDRQI